MGESATNNFANFAAIFKPQKIDIITDGLSNSRLTPAEFCQVALFDSPKDTQSMQPLRKASMRFYPDDGKWYITVANGMPQVADTVLDEKNPDNVLGFITKINRRLPNSTLYEVEFEDVKAEAPFQTIAQTQSVQVMLREFKMHINAACKSVATPDVIATFVSERGSAGDTLFRDWILRGAAISGAFFPDTPQTEAELIARYNAGDNLLPSLLSDAFNQMHDDMNRGCYFDIVNGRCAQRLDTAIEQAGEVPLYSTYIQDTTQFQADLETILVPQTPEVVAEEAAEVATIHVAETEPVAAGEAKVVAAEEEEEPEEKNYTPTMQVYSLEDVKALCAFFFVPEKQYNEWEQKERVTRIAFRKSKHKCEANYLLRLHRRVFECYLSNVNALWQDPDMNPIKQAAIMWLLYYTQLPVFVLKFMLMLKEELDKNYKKVYQYARVQAMIQTFHKDLVDNLALWLPMSDAASDAEQYMTVADTVHSILKDKAKILVPVIEQVTQSLGEPDC
jgi:hypothetical protein